MYSGLACLKHSNFLKVNIRSRPPASECRAETTEGCKAPLRNHWGRHWHTHRNPTTSFLTATTLIYAIGAGITAAAGTRLALQLFLTKGKKIGSFQFRIKFGSLFLVTTSLSQDWVIYASAAILRCGSRFSGSLSGIEP
jgi:hypothetical protein